MTRAHRTLGAVVISVAAATALAMAGLAPAGAHPTSIVVENGATQPVFDYDDAIQEVVYVEAPMDSDGDGANDLIAVDVIRPAETAGGLKVPSIMEASPYYGRSYNPAPDQTKGFPGWWDEFFVPRATPSFSRRCRGRPAPSAARPRVGLKTPSASRRSSTG